MEPQYINNLGNWKPDTQDKFYLYHIPINIMRLMSGASESHNVHYHQRTVPKPPEELQILIFPFIQQWGNSFSDIDASDTMPTYCALYDFMDRGRKLMI